MFPGASALGDSINSLFGGPQDAQQQYYTELTKQAREARVSSQGQTQGVRDMPSTNSNYAAQNSPEYGNQKGKPAATEEPQEVEARWMARLIKFAGITQATGVKIGQP